MKAIKILSLVFIAFHLFACNSGDDIKPISPKINGPLGKFFEIVDRVYVIKDGNVSVEFKRIANGGPITAYEVVGNNSSTASFLVELLDNTGNVISSKEIDPFNSHLGSDKQLEMVFSLGIDETSSIIIDFGSIKGKAAFFKVSSKWNPIGSTDKGAAFPVSNDEYSSEFINDVQQIDQFPYDCTMQGLIDNKYGVTMHLVQQGRGVISGDYYYNKNGENNKLELSGSIVGNNIELDEYNSNLQKTGHFLGSYANGSFSGSFNTPGGKKMSFALYLLSDMGGSNSSTSYDNSFSQHKNVDSRSVNIDVSGENWDEFIDAYERYVNQLIPYIRKASAGDMATLADYPKMLKEAEKFSEKIQNANTKGGMNSQQWQRYLKIQNKLLQETNRIQKKAENMFDE